MIVPSIDLVDGSAVQLIGGKEMALDAGDPRPLARRFGRVGDVAVIDLDAALGRGSNEQTIRDLLKTASCRVGGGIRSVAAARAWLDAGASSVILGTAATPEVLAQLPRGRVWAALDCVAEEVVDEGWTRATGRNVFERMRELSDYVEGFLVTLVEGEGRMGGLDLAMARRLRDAAGDRRLTLAGGIVSAEEVAILDALGIDAQVGMALYTGAMGLGEAVVGTLTSDRDDGLFPTVVCDERGAALGLVYSSKESVRVAIDEGRGVFQSRTRGLWRKGETSGATQELLGIDVDCDRDALRFRVRQHGAGFCHQGTCSCWGDSIGLAALDATLSERAEQAPAGSYTRRLMGDPALLQAKLLEEAQELAMAVAPEDVAWEAADLIYFALVRARAAGVSLADIEAQLASRAGKVTRRRGDAKPAPEARPQRQLLPDRAPSAAIRRGCAVDEDVMVGASRIVRDVRQNGEAALLSWSEKLGDLLPGQPWKYERPQLEVALARIPSEQRELLERTSQRIEQFARAQREMFVPVQLAVDGGFAGHRVQPVQSAGCYAPGGRFPLPSSVLMTAVTARVAGVERVIVASPKPDDLTLAAAAIAGADQLLAVGGAQAVAALAYGAGDVDAVDMIVGPGNAWVTAAKKLVSGDVGIDMLAGPSELLVVADSGVNPAVVAADLIAQAEHDPDAVPILLTLDGSLVEKVRAALADQLTDLATAEIAAVALRNGYAVVVETRPEAVEVCNQLAPEHLELLVANPSDWLPQLHNYGGVFVGAGSAEVLGDYGAGPNHVLPTGGTARFTAGLSVADFLRLPTWLRVEDPALLVPDAMQLARLEGLEGHARSAQRRGEPWSR